MNLQQKNREKSKCKRYDGHCAGYSSHLYHCTVFYPDRNFADPDHTGAVCTVLAGIILGKWKGVVCTVIYLLLGMVGLPVFNGFSGGVQKLVGPTGGYLDRLPVFGIFTGLFVEKFPNKIPMYFVGGIIGIIVCYAFGTVWFVLQYKVGFLEALTMCVFPYIPMDLVKLVAAVIIGSQVRKILIRQNLIS